MIFTNISKISKQWIKSIMLVVIVVLFLCSLLLGSTLFFLKNALVNNISNLAEFTKNTIDSRLLEMQKYVLGLELHPINIRAKKQADSFDTYSAELYNLTNQLQNYKNINSIIGGILVYYPNSGLVVGNLGCFPVKSYYLLENNYQGNGFDGWLAAVRQSGNGFTLFDTGFGSAQLWYVKDLPYEGQKDGHIVVKLNTAELLRNVKKNISADENFQTYAVYLYDKLVDYAGKPDGLAESFGGVQGPPFSSSRGLEVHIPSFYPNISYRSFYSYTDILRPFYIALIICIVSFLAVCLIASYIAYHISRKNARPVDLLLQKIGVDPCAETDAMRAIAKNIDSLLNTNDEQFLKLQSQQDVISALFLNQIVEETFANEKLAFSLANKYGIVFEYSFFIVCVLVERCRGSVDRKNELFAFFHDTHYETTIAYKNNAYIVLLNLEEAGLPADFSGILCKAGETVCAETKPRIGMGSCYDTIAGIPKSYHEALWAVKNSENVETGGVFLYNDFYFKHNRHWIDLQQALYERDYTRSLTCLAKLFDNPDVSSWSGSKLEFVFSPVKRLIVDCLCKAQKSNSRYANEDFDDTCLYDSAPKVKKQLTRMILLLRKMDPDTSTRLSVAERAKQIIEQEFTDPLFGPYKVADELNISNSYLSTIFKSAYGVGAVQYINQLRIQQAKNLILTTNLGLKEIAVSAGFSSDISFIRVFKKYESTTPGTLRKRD